ncbi:hypothetical protein PTTG_25615 [Puccinia triticina 1-1 BBBD Race 1]|uniref:Golgi to ER traffic-protein n=3 Tax=Puccinia triticina TaxID=208348 RepID=A0A180H1L5_PUCT1|nr:hypothetical protein PTTG_25615 [Puccinia triticina 1-1 BBBD Race 1]
MASPCGSHTHTTRTASTILSNPKQLVDDGEKAPKASSTSPALNCQEINKSWETPPTEEASTWHKATALLSDPDCAAPNPSSQANTPNLDITSRQETTVAKLFNSPSPRNSADNGIRATPNTSTNCRSDGHQREPKPASDSTDPIRSPSPKSSTQSSDSILSSMSEKAPPSHEEQCQQPTPEELNGNSKPSPDKPAKTTPISSNTKTALAEQKKKDKAERAAAKRKARLACNHRIVPETGALMSKVWPALSCELMKESHGKMQKDSKNPRWDYGPQLMGLVADIIDWSALDLHRTAYYTDFLSFTASAEAIAAFSVILDPNFYLCLIQCPRLIQVASNDPFFQQEVIRMDLIKQAFESKDEVKAVSWKTLYQMMIRTNDTPEYTDNEEAQAMFASAFRKLHSLAKSSYSLFHQFIRMPEPLWPDSNKPKRDPLMLAGIFIIGKIKVLEAGATGPTLQDAVCHPHETEMPTKDSNKPRKAKVANGLLVLQKRIWETLLCCLMMLHSQCSADLADSKVPGPKPKWTKEEAERLKKYDHGLSLFDDGDLSNATPNDKKRWSKMRLSAFGSMAVFLLYGVAGWWHCLVDSHNFNKSDVWALMHLAHAKHKWLYVSGQYTKREPADTPWYTLDSFIRWLLYTSGIGSKDPHTIDWHATLDSWATHLNNIQIARFALQDILEEVSKGQADRQTSNYNGDVAPDVKLNKAQQASANDLQSTVATSWQETSTMHANTLQSGYDSKVKSQAPTPRISPAPNLCNPSYQT